MARSEAEFLEGAAQLFGLDVDASPEAEAAGLLMAEAFLLWRRAMMKKNFGKDV